MQKLLLLSILAILGEAQYITHGYYTDSNCLSLMATETATLNNCINSNDVYLVYKENGR